MLIEGIILSLLAGLSITAGAWLASLDYFKTAWLKEEIRHSVAAFSCGALFSAITFILIPDGADKQTPISTLITFMLGGIVFMIADIALFKSKTRISQFIAIMLDFIPEAIILGAIVTQDYNHALFLAIIIAGQNLPEGYSAFIELRTKHNKSSILSKFLLIGLTGPVYVLLGSIVFVNQPVMLGMIMTFCSGGILYLLIEDIAPYAIMKKHWLPPLGTIFGFMIGLAGHLYI